MAREHGFDEIRTGTCQVLLYPTRAYSSRHLTWSRDQLIDQLAVGSRSNEKQNLQLTGASQKV